MPVARDVAVEDHRRRVGECGEERGVGGGVVGVSDGFEGVVAPDAGFRPQGADPDVVVLGVVC